MTPPDTGFFDAEVDSAMPTGREVELLSGDLLRTKTEHVLAEATDLVERFCKSQALSIRSFKP